MNKLVSVLILAFCFPLTLLAQNKTIKGKVVDENGSPAVGVSVVAKGAKKGTSTDNDGNFSITVKATGSVDLVFSSTEYVSKIVTAEGDKELSVELKRTVTTGEDVVVIGYQTVKRKDLLNPVASVSAKDLKDIPVNSAAEAITGRLAGVQVTTTEGSPNADVSVRVRGGGSLTQDNSPLYIIDGIQVENGLSVISPQDIESIDVLKDAAATAIYGARGANGVVVITTKGGKDGKNVISYNGFTGIRQLPEKLPLFNVHEYIVYQHERALRNTEDLEGFLERYGTTYTDWKNYADTVPSVDWQEEIFGRNAKFQTHNLSFSGGNKTTQYNLSLTRNTEEGIMLNTEFTRNLLSFKLKHTLNNNIKLNFTARYRDQDVLGQGTSSREGQSQNRLRNTIKYKPYVNNPMGIDDFDPSVDDDTQGAGLNLINPFVLVRGEYRNTKQKLVNLGGSIDFKLTKWLSFKTTLGIDNSFQDESRFYDKFTSLARGAVGQGLPVADINTQDRIIINNSNVLTFNSSKIKGSFKENNSLDIFVGQEMYRKSTKENNVRNNFFPLDITYEKALALMSLGTSVPGYPNSNQYQESLLSYFGKVNYAYKQKYLFGASLRADGSSKFAPENRWGYFPSASVAWRVSKEKFMDNVSTYYVSDLKFRFGYGTSGNNRIDDYLYNPFFSTTAAYPSYGNPAAENSSPVQYFTGPGSGTLNVGYGPTSLANRNLKWETTTSQNLGVDLELFKSKIQLSVDLYWNNTTDLLLNQTIPFYTGYTSQIQNIGETKNTGIEFQLSASIIQKKNFSWNANFNTAFNKNKIVNIGSFNPYQSSQWTAGYNDFVVLPGLSVGTMWGFQTDGFYGINDFDYVESNPTGQKYVLKEGQPVNSYLPQIEPGVVKFRDVSGPEGKPDGIVNDMDRTVIGDAQPKFTGGLSQQLSYKNFDLSIFMNWVVGNDIYNANNIEFTSPYQKETNMLAIMNDRWRITDEFGNDMRDADPATYGALNANATIWQPIFGNSQATSFLFHSWAVEDGSFLRINNVSLGYTFPSRLLKKIRATNFRIYGTVNNLAVITGYSGYDPEVDTRSKVNPLARGVDFSAYPRSRSYIIGVNLAF